MKILIDMNLSAKWVDVLLNANFSAVHCSTFELSTSSDFEIMQYANRNNYVVMTNDLDFGAILAATNGHKPSVVQIRGDNLSVNDLSDYVIKALITLKPELEAGALITVDIQRTRVRILPLAYELR